MLQIFPDTEHAAQIDAQLAISMQPAVPRGVRPLGPGNDPGDPRLLENTAHKSRELPTVQDQNTAAARKHLVAERRKASLEKMDE